MKTHKTTYFKFKTKKEAEAFIRGVEYVNDSSLEIYYIGKRLGGYMLRIDERV